MGLLDELGSIFSEEVQNGDVEKSLLQKIHDSTREHLRLVHHKRTGRSVGGAKMQVAVALVKLYKEMDATAAERTDEFRKDLSMILEKNPQAESNTETRMHHGLPGPSSAPVPLPQTAESYEPSGAAQLWSRAMRKITTSVVPIEAAAAPLPRNPPPLSPDYTSPASPVEPDMGELYDLAMRPRKRRKDK